MENVNSRNYEEKKNHNKITIVVVVIRLSINYIAFLESQEHLTPQSHASFNFQKYIGKSLEEDFKVIVGIRLIFHS